MGTVDHDVIQRHINSAKEDKAQAESAIAGWTRELHQIEGKIAFGEHLLATAVKSVERAVESVAGAVVHLVRPAAGAAEDAANMVSGETMAMTAARQAEDAIVFGTGGTVGTAPVAAPGGATDSAGAAKANS